MKIPRMANAVGQIDDDLTAAAENCKRNKKNNWIKWGSLAACFAVLIITGVAFLPSLSGGNIPNETKDRYKDHTVQVGESGIIWSWEYQTVYEQYKGLEIDGVKYFGIGREVSETYVANKIGSHTVTGYDTMNESQEHTKEFEVYKLKDAAQSQFVAVKMDGKYYVFKNNKYAPPSTLGELFNLVDLPNAITLNRFSENWDNQNKNHFILNNDDYVWEVLADCENADFIEDDKWKVFDRNYLTFTITSEVLGVYKVAMYVTEDGYLWTNAFSYQYLFDIGEDAAGKIIKYAKENSTKTDDEPYRNTVTGTVIEITDEYILVDDSVLCINPEDRIIYKILLNDLKISRYVDRGIIEVGDTVQVAFEGDLGEENTIADAVDISEAKISGGDVLIPE